VSLPNRDVMAAIAVTRFGLGAKPGELDKAKADPKGYLKAQITRPAAPLPTANLPDSATRFIAYRDFQQAKKDPDLTPADRMRRQEAIGAQEELLARFQLAAQTDAPFAERWSLFWANHFTVAATKGVSAPQVGPFEREVIRPHAFDLFETMLFRSSSHPGMLLYLDQAQSVGPNSPAAQFIENRGRLAGARPAARLPGLNENLAREIMELHTVGLGAGYTQTDVTEFAKALTGWGVGGPRDAADLTGKFVYHDSNHEPGARTVLGKRYEDTDSRQALAILHDLANHPATAKHIARKLAVHFVSDDPPPALVDKLAAKFSASGGDLAQVATALIDADEAWQPDAAKFKTPYEFLISCWRGMNGAPVQAAQMLQPARAMGQDLFRAPSPKGWDDVAAAWATPSNVIQRLTFSEDFSAKAAANRSGEPLAAAQACLGARLTPQTAAAMASAESRKEALTILFMSPEFQRR
jgi:uncharacterized protein (DUF1800 family)